MEKLRTRIVFAPDIPQLEELAVNWDNVVRDIQQYLAEQGFSWQRGIGYVADEIVPAERLAQIAKEIGSIAVGCLLYLNSDNIGETCSMLHLFKE